MQRNFIPMKVPTQLRHGSIRTRFSHTEPRLCSLQIGERLVKHCCSGYLIITCKSGGGFPTQTWCGHLSLPNHLQVHNITATSAIYTNVTRLPIHDAVRKSGKNMSRNLTTGTDIIEECGVLMYRKPPSFELPAYFSLTEVVQEFHALFQTAPIITRLFCTLSPQKATLSKFLQVAYQHIIKRKLKT